MTNLTNHLPTPPQIDELAEQIYKLLSSNYEEAYNLLEPLQQQLETIYYPLGRVYYDFLLASVHYAKSELSTALTLTLQALTHLPEAELPPMWAYRIYTRIAITYMLLGSFADALNYGFLAQKTAERLDTHREKLLSAINLGAIYVSFKELDDALIYLEQALKLSEANNHAIKSLYALCLINFAQVYSELKAYDKATYCAQTIVDIAPQIESPYEQKRMKYAALMNLAAIATSQKEPEKTIQYAEEVIRHVAGDPHLIQVALEANNTLFEAYVLLKNHTQALEVLQKGIELAHESEFLGYEYQFYEGMARVYAEMGQFQQAFEAYQKYHHLKEQVFNEENQKKVQNLEVLHQTELAKKEAALYAELYQEEQTRRKLAETLREVGTLITSSLELEQVLEKILNYLADLVPYDRAILLRLEGQKLVVLTISGE